MAHSIESIESMKFFDKVLTRELAKPISNVKAMQIAHRETAIKFKRKNPLQGTS
jgi:hypothetical protein